MTPGDEHLNLTGNQLNTNPDPEFYTIVFNDNAGKKHDQPEPEKNMYFFSSKLETIIWVGGVLALVFAIVTAIDGRLPKFQ